MVNQINQWVQNGCEYQEGLSIYDQYGTDLFLKRILKKGPDAFNRQKLNEALVALRKKHEAAPVEVAVAAAPGLIIPQNAPPIAPINPATKTETPALLKITRERDNNYAELRALHAYLHTTPDGEELRQIALRIGQLGKKGAVLWERYNYVVQHGEEPESIKAEAPAILVDMNLLNKRENLRKSINKAEQRIKKQEKPKPNTLELIAKNKLDLKALDEQIAVLKAGGNK